jgi:hypothetical protein
MIKQLKVDLERSGLSFNLPNIKKITKIIGKIEMPEAKRKSYDEIIDPEKLNYQDIYKEVIEFNPIFYDPSCLFQQSAFSFFSDKFQNIFVEGSFFLMLQIMGPSNFLFFSEKVDGSELCISTEILFALPTEDKMDEFAAKKEKYRDDRINSSRAEFYYDSLIFAVTYSFCLYKNGDGYSGSSVAVVRQYENYDYYTSVNTEPLLNDRFKKLLDDFRGKSTTILKPILSMPYLDYFKFINTALEATKNEKKEKKITLTDYTNIFLGNIEKIRQNFFNRYKTPFLLNLFTKKFDEVILFLRDNTLAIGLIDPKDISKAINEANQATFKELEHQLPLNTDDSIKLFLKTFLVKLRIELTTLNQQLIGSFKALINNWPRLFLILLGSEKPTAGGRRTHRKCRNQRKRLTF